MKIMYLETHIRLALPYEKSIRLYLSFTGEE